jgi:hypothetical protein
VRKIYRTCSIDPVRPASDVGCYDDRAIDVCRVSPTSVADDPAISCGVCHRGSVTYDDILPDSCVEDCWNKHFHAGNANVKLFDIKE